LSPAGAPLARSSGAWLFRDSRLVCSPFRSALRPPLPFRLPVGGSPSLPARFGLLWPLLTSRSALLPARRPFRHEASSPQVRLVVFPAQSPDLRRSPLVARASRFRDRSPWLAPPHIRRPPLLGEGASCSSTRGFCSPLLSAPASRPDRSPGFFALRFARGRCDQLPPGFSPVHHLHAGHTRSRFAAGQLDSACCRSGVGPGRKGYPGGPPRARPRAA
jgi:hypothetical protein